MDDRLEERVAALERTITDGHADDGLPEAARMDARLDELEATVDDVDDRVAELDAAVQALRGFAGGVRAVDEAVERRADAAVARVDRLEAELAEVREAVNDRNEAGVANEPAGWNGSGATNESTGRDEPRVANESADCGHATAPHRDARTTAPESGRRESSVAGSRSTKGDGRVGDRSRDHDGSLTGEVAANTDAALADAAAMDEQSDAAADRSLAERIRRLL